VKGSRISKPLLKIRNYFVMYGFSDQVHDVGG